MISSEDFIGVLREKGIDFFCGIPDSLLKNMCACIADVTSPSENIITANEGSAIGLAAGFHLATGKIPVVYMQNSGIGNAINPLLSLVDRDVYSIPILLIIGWRGEPGVNDEPQHFKQGKVTLGLLDALQIPYKILPSNCDEMIMCMNEIFDVLEKVKSPVAIIVRKDTFENYKLESKKDEDENVFTRENALRIIVDKLDSDDIIVSTTGMASRELFELREFKKESHKNDFLTVGSMGHANQIAFGISLLQTDRKVYCIDGDGAFIMHAGGIGAIGDLAPANYKHIVLNNGAHDSVGGQPTIGKRINMCKIAESFGYKKSFSVASSEDLEKIFSIFKESQGPALLEVRISKGARSNLGRPTTTTIENKIEFMNSLIYGV